VMSMSLPRNEKSDTLRNDISTRVPQSLATHESNPKSKHDPL